MKTRLLWCSEFSELKTGYSVYTKEILSRLNNTRSFEIHEQACYAHQSDPRTQKVPWVVYCNMPDQNNEQEKNEYNSNTSNQFGAWRFEDVCLDCKAHCVIDVRDFWMCIVKGANIVEYSGVKNIENIKVGDLVLTHTGKYKKVIKTFKRTTFEQINVIKSSHCPFEVCLTNNHPVLCIPNEKRKNCNFPNSPPTWINAENIKKNDLVVFPVDDFGTNELPLDICRLIGYYTAEGCLMYEGKKEKNILKGIQLTFNINEKKYIKDVSRIVKHYYNKETKIKPRGNAVTLRIFGRKIASDMECYANSLSGNKCWSSFIFHMTKDCCKHLLCGLFRGDGGYYQNRATYCTKSKQLAHQVFRLCLRFGILPSFNLNNNKYNNKVFTRYIFYFSSTNFHGFVNICKLLNTEIKKSKRIINNNAILTIKDVYKYTRGEDVYNLQIEDDETYVSSFCVHNCSHEFYSPFRPYYHHLIMPTVDSEPQNEEWISEYKTADGVFTYQDWSKNVLDKEGAGQIKTLCEAPPAADEVFQPMDSHAIKKSIGLENYRIVGTVMRNQRRKLFPDLFQSFKQFLMKSGRQDVLLYCHTSYPDMGWDIPRLLLQHGLSSKVLFTYVCRECGHAHPHFFSDALIHCPRCRKLSAGMSNVQTGVDNKVLAAIYNMFDFYLQISNSEGYGMPMAEAGACGIPVIGVDYSAMTDVIRKLDGFPIPPLTLSTEMETGCYRAIPDNNKLTQLLIELFSMSNELFQNLKQKTRNAYLKNYGWDKTAKKWYDYIANIDPEYYENKWNQKPNYHNPPKDYPKHLTNTVFARWLITDILGEPWRINSYMEARLIRDLNYSTSNISPGGMYFNEHSTLFGKPNWKHFTQEDAFKHFVYLCNKKNYWEKRRWEKVNKQ